MKSFCLKMTAMACLVACPLIFSGWNVSSSGGIAAQETERTEPTEEQTRKPPRGRVPAGFVKIGISEKQREQIYEIQARYREQVEELLEQLEELKAQEAEEIHSILSDRQKAALQEYRANAAAERRKSSSND
jgi:hypothetical protein